MGRKRTRTKKSPRPSKRVRVETRETRPDWDPAAFGVDTAAVAFRFTGSFRFEAAARLQLPAIFDESPDLQKLLARAGRELRLVESARLGQSEWNIVRNALLACAKLAKSGEVQVECEDVVTRFLAGVDTADEIPSDVRASITDTFTAVSAEQAQELAARTEAERASREAAAAAEAEALEAAAAKAEADAAAEAEALEAQAAAEAREAEAAAEAKALEAAAKAEAEAAEVEAREAAAAAQAAAEAEALEAAAAAETKAAESKAAEIKDEKTKRAGDDGSGVITGEFDAVAAEAGGETKVIDTKADDDWDDWGDGDSSADDDGWGDAGSFFV